MVTKLGRMMAYLDCLLPGKSRDPLITWPCKIGVSLTRVGSARKRLSRHRFLVVNFELISPFSSVSIVDSEQVNVSWEFLF